MNVSECLSSSNVGRLFVCKRHELFDQLNSHIWSHRSYDWLASLLFIVCAYLHAWSLAFCLYYAWPSSYAVVCEAYG